MSATPAAAITSAGAASQPTLPLSEKWGYGIGDFGINLFFMSAMTYLTYFYTDVFGLTAAAVTVLLLVARLVDAVTDPLMGMLMDRTRSRWGPLRPYLLFGAIPMSVLLVLVFTVPDLDAGGKLVWAYVTYILFGIAYTVVGLPYSSLTARMTNDYDERTTLSTIRMACAFSGGLAVSVGTPLLVSRLGADEASGYQNTMILYGILATALLWIAFGSAKERVKASPKEVLPLNDARSWRPILQNPHLWVVIGIFCCGMLGFTVRSAVTPYYFKYFVQRPDLISVYFLVTLSTMVVGLIAVPWLAERLGKTRTLYVGSIVTLIGCVALFFMSADAIVGIFVSGCVVALGATPVAVLGWAMLPDTVEYAQWRHGVRADGLIYSVASFVQKVGKMLGGVAVTGMLWMAGFVANAEPTAETTQAIVGLMTWVPAAVVIPLIVFAAMHRLDEETHRQIVAELAERAEEPGAEGEV